MQHIQNQNFSPTGHSLEGISTHDEAVCTNVDGYPADRSARCGNSQPGIRAGRTPRRRRQPGNRSRLIVRLRQFRSKAPSIPTRKRPSGFPNLIAPYKPISVPTPAITNTPKIEQMIHDGKLELTLQDAVELGLANNMDIAVARYNPWFADTDILKSEAGGFGCGTAGASIPNSQANIPFLNLDPMVTSTILYDSQTIPVNNPLIAGTGAAPVTALSNHTAQYNFGISQGFTTGTTVSLAWDNTRSSSSAAFNSFNPAVQSSLYVTISQQLLNGFGLDANRRNIMISKNNRKIADLGFTQQAITTVTNTINAYWELVYARENVEVQQQAVTVAEKLYNDNKNSWKSAPWLRWT